MNGELEGLKVVGIKDIFVLKLDLVGANHGLGLQLIHHYFPQKCFARSAKTTELCSE